MAPRENENKAYAKFGVDKQRTLWYAMVFSGVVNSLFSLLEFSIFLRIMQFSSNCAVGHNLRSIVQKRTIA